MIKSNTMLKQLHRSLIGIAFVGAISAPAKMVPVGAVAFDSSTNVDLSALSELSFGSSDGNDSGTILIDRSGVEWADDNSESSKEALDSLSLPEERSDSFDGVANSASLFQIAEDIFDSVHGTDERVRVFNTTEAPQRMIGRIALGCTGTLIGPRHVLTAGHCVYNVKTNKWYENLDFTPAQNGSATPYGTVKWKRALSVKSWTTDHKTESDYAVIVLDTPVGNNLGWFAYGYTDSLSTNTTINIKGYPGDKAAGTMWHSDCKLSVAGGETVDYLCDTAPGESGSGVYVYKKATNERTIHAVHTNGIPSKNWATRITHAKFDKIKGWKAENP